MSDVPIPCAFDGEHFTPVSPYWSTRAGQAYAVGQRYIMAQYSDRSRVSHDHFFAALEEAWKNLPDEHAASFPTPEHLRKHALIETGFFDESRMFFETQQIARKVAGELAKQRAKSDTYCIVSVYNTIVVQRWAKSQNYRAMKRKEFQESKTSVLEWVSRLVGVTAEELKANAGRAA
jgi:hypothetical protein